MLHLLPFLLACPDASLIVLEADPEVAILEPSDGTSFAAGAPVSFTAIIDDNDDLSDTLALSWVSDLDGTLSGTNDRDDRVVVFTIDTLAEGVHTVTLTATDKNANRGEDSISVEILPNTLPTVAYTSPGAGAILPLGEDIFVAIEVEDPDEQDMSLMALEWRLDGVTWLDGPTALLESGDAQFHMAGTSLGSHSLEVMVVDTAGAEVAATLEFELMEWDADGDGYGPTALGGEDCDDADSDIHPEAQEVCDEDDVDEDCDGLVDDDDPDVEGQIGGYVDADGDGYGDPESWTLSCDPGSLTDDHQDCMDTNDAVHPGMEEVCNDGVDNDCSGVDDFCGWWDDHSLSEAALEIHGEESAQYAPGGTIGGMDLDGDGIDDLLIAIDLASGSAGSATGAVHLISGSPSLVGVHGLDAASQRIEGDQADDRFGSAVSAGDVNGDGVIDLLIGSPLADHAGTDDGEARLIFGPWTGDLLASEMSFVATGSAAFDGAGTAVALGGNLGGDLDGDGLDEIVITAPGHDSFDTSAGAAFIILGDAALTGTLDLDDADIKIMDGGHTYHLGSAAALVGDTNHDGLDELLLAAEDWGANGHESGAVFLFYGDSGTFTAGNALDCTSAAASYFGSTSSEHVGHSIAGLGDVDGSGFNDLAIGGDQVHAITQDEGAAYVILDPRMGAYDLASSADISFLGTQNGELVGSAVAPAGDIDGDGTIDLLVGARDHETTATGDGTGLSYLFYGPIGDLGGDVPVTEADANFLGESWRDYAGSTLGPAGDFDGDGWDDFWVGAPGQDGGGSDAGALYVVFGKGI